VFITRNKDLGNIKKRKEERRKKNKEREK